MARRFDRQLFLAVFDRWIAGGDFQEEPSYYPRYVKRYESLIEIYAEIAGPAPADVLDIGGGVYALLVQKMWGDRAAVADIEQLSYIGKAGGVASHVWNLAEGDAPFEERFDVIFFSEVIEHLPIPGYVALQRLRKVLKPGGVLICSTPNFYRLRNVVYVAIGRNIFDNMRLPEDGATGHVVEYDRARLLWAMEKADFRDIEFAFRQFPHEPAERVLRLMSRMGSPLFRFQRFRESMVVTARA